MWQLQRLDVVKKIVRHSGNIYYHKKNVEESGTVNSEGLLLKI